MSGTTMTVSRPTAITLWILRVVLAVLFLFAAIMKLSGQQMEVDVFGQVGLGQWFRYVTGLMELVGAIALVVPRVSALGALLLLVVDLGAFVAQVAVLHQDWIHTLVIGALLGVVVYLQRDKLPIAK